MNTALIFLVVGSAAVVVYAGVWLISGLQRKTWLILTCLGIATYAVLLALRPGFWWLSSIGVLAAAVLAGSLIGRQLSSQAALIAFSITAAIVDTVSFSGGLTKKIISNYALGKSLLLQYLTVSLPLKGKIIPLVGIGDLLIMGAIFYALLKLGYPGWQCLVVPLAGLLAALIVGLITKGIFGIPFIAVAVILFLVYKQKTASTDRRKSG